MKILFSPSETKHSGGTNMHFSKEDFLFPALFEKRELFLKHYRDFITHASLSAKEKLFGTKKQNVIDYYSADIFFQKTMKVVERYDGVAYNYLSYSTLNDAAQKYIDKNVIIFSNLFGPLLAGDNGLPDYKFKQGEKLDKLAPENFYCQHFSSALDSMLSKEPYLDLRAGFYNKFYKPSTPYTTLKFIKDGKVISHWAKAYRGIVLRHLAINHIKSMDAFMQMEIPTLSVVEITQKSIHTEIVYSINSA